MAMPMEGKVKKEPRIILIVQTDIAPEMEEEFNRWYEEEHIPLLLQVPGVLSARRGVSKEGSPKYVAIYEHENINVQKSPAYQKAIETEWTSRIRPHFKNFTRRVLLQIYPDP
jgi:antibiotic biosynthesis monooxygenase (ABM) superfamily enzyme